VDELKPWVPEGMTMAEMAQRWILDHEAVSVVITGASRPEQVTDNAKASELPKLPAALHTRLTDFYTTEVAEYIRGPY
jgi:aryl-alcohol dehydrogenase-like predicted oxidoreductase